MDAFGDYDSVATARALRVMLAFEDSGAALSGVVPDGDAGCDREALARALEGHESLRELGDKELSALLGEAGRFVDDERRVARVARRGSRTSASGSARLAARLHLAEAPAAAPGPAPGLVPEGEAPPPSPSAVSPDAAATAIAACWREARPRRQRRRHRGGGVSAVARPLRAGRREKRRIRRDRITRETEVSRERHKRLGALQAELERLKKTPAELASTYEAVHARRREARLKRWREEEEEALKPRRGSARPTSSSAAILDYRRAVKAGTVGATIADALEIYRRGPNSGAPLADDPTPEDNARRIQEIRDKILVKVRNKRNFLDPAAVDDKRGVPEFPFGKPMTWKKKPIKRRAMVGSILKAAQEAEDRGEDGDAAAKKAAEDFIQSHGGYGGGDYPKSAFETPAAKRKSEAATKDYTPGACQRACTVDEDGEVKTTYAEKSFAGHHGARRKYEEYFAAKERARNSSPRTTRPPQRAELRALRKRHLDRAMMLAKKMANPPKIERDKDIDFGEPEPGSDDPAGWWRLPPPGEDRDKALKAHANTVRAMEGKDEWWRVRLPEDACGPPIDIRDVCPPLCANQIFNPTSISLVDLHTGPPNVPWPFPSKFLKNLPPEKCEKPMDEYEASLWWYAWCRKGLAASMEGRKGEKIKQRPRPRASAPRARVWTPTASPPPSPRRPPTRRTGPTRRCGSSTRTAAALEMCKRARRAPEDRARRRQERRAEVDRMKDDMIKEVYRLAALKNAPGNVAAAREADEACRAGKATKIQAFYRGARARAAAEAQRRDAKVFGALETLVSELGGGPAASADFGKAASRLSTVFAAARASASPESASRRGDGRTVAFAPSPARSPGEAPKTPVTIPKLDFGVPLDMAQALAPAGPDESASADGVPEAKAATPSPRSFSLFGDDAAPATGDEESVDDLIAAARRRSQGGFEGLLG
ncbi:hypothetical protein JL721_9763 [Aureococcus anophagefferens]|nr:hypothetical protein JL721_9763 [Aureococcus anophagefferens]